MGRAMPFFRNGAPVDRAVPGLGLHSGLETSDPWVELPLSKHKRSKFPGTESPVSAREFFVASRSCTGGLSAGRGVVIERWSCPSLRGWIVRTPATAWQSSGDIEQGEAVGLQEGILEACGANLIGGIRGVDLR